MEKILEMKKIRKSFPGVLALNDVDLDLYSGEVLALLGENGAGKTTLMNILSGAYVPDSGEIYFNGKKLPPNTPGERLEKGIAVIYQELNYFKDLSITENVFIGKLPVTKLGIVDHKKMYEDAKDILASVGLHKDPNIEAGSLSIAEKQLMEIAKALSMQNNKILVMDEPTAALSDTEIKKLFELIRALTAQGKAVIYISHKMNEIFEISNRVQVLRDGEYVGIRTTAETTPSELVSMMVGRTITDMYPKEQIDKGDCRFEVINVCGAQCKDVSFNVHKGEILGVFGLMGAGRTEIMETILGVRKKYSGSIKMDDKPIDIRNPEDAINAKIAYLPRERKADGLVMVSSVKDNMTLSYLQELQGIIGLKLKKEKSVVLEWIKKLSIKTPGINTPISSLSGGNQQKVALAKWMMKEPKLLILNEPTRGVDVGAKVEIYKLIEEFCRAGLAIIMISSETPEIMGIADRIIVIHEGTVAGELLREDFTQEKLMFMAIGGAD